MCGGGVPSPLLFSPALSPESSVASLFPSEYSEDGLNDNEVAELGLVLSEIDILPRPARCTFGVNAPTAPIEAAAETDKTINAEGREVIWGRCFGCFVAMVGMG